MRRIRNPAHRTLEGMISASFLPSPILLLPSRDSGPGIRLDREPDLVRVRAGVYAEARSWHALPPWDRYLARVHAFALVSTGTVFSHESAAALHGLPLFGEPRDIHVFSPHRRTSTRYDDVLVHTSEDDRDIVEREGLAVVGAPDTAIDLAKCLPPAFGLAVWDALLHVSPDPDRLRAELAMRIGARADGRGRRRLVWVEQTADPRSESVGESVSRAVIQWLGFPEPELQWTFAFEGAIDRGDFFWPRHRVLGESDGYGKYEDTDAERVMAHLRREKTREDRLRRHLAAVARWDWAATMKGWPIGDRLRHAGLRPLRDPDVAALATLASNPRSAPRAGGETQLGGRESGRRRDSRPWG